jgi:hypothetical protein
LEAFFNAMNAFDAFINRGKTYRFDWFSVREDFMGLKTLDDEGQPAEYIDPVTGETHDAIGMFRAILARSVRPVQGGQQIVVEFNTVRQIPGGFFFVGPTFNLDGSVDGPKAAFSTKSTTCKSGCPATIPSDAPNSPAT